MTSESWNRVGLVSVNVGKFEVDLDFIGIGGGEAEGIPL